MLTKTLAILADPVTKKPLQLLNGKVIQNQIIEGTLKEDSGDEYAIHLGLANLIPKKEKMKISPNILEVWNKLQDQGQKLYENFPQLNLSVEKRKIVRIFKEFSTFHGLVLDVGCGPQIPAYLERNKDVELVIGIDPLICLYQQKKNQPIDLLRAMAEFMPFKDASFDNICFATSFDHVIDPRVVLQETRRLLKRDGTAIFWIEGNGKQPHDKLQKSFFRKACGKMIWLARQQAYKIKIPDEKKQALLEKSMKVPNGAVDKFHLRHFKYDEFHKMAQLLKFKMIEKMELPDYSSTLLKYELD